MTKQEQIQDLQLAVLRGDKKYKGIELPAPQETGTMTQRIAFARQVAQRLYTLHYEKDDKKTCQCVSKVYVIDEDDVPKGTFYGDLSDEEFIDIAKKIFELSEFVKAFNNEEVSTVYHLIRII